MTCIYDWHYWLLQRRVMSLKETCGDKSVCWDHFSRPARVLMIETPLVYARLFRESP